MSFRSPTKVGINPPQAGKLRGELFAPRRDSCYVAVGAKCRGGRFRIPMHRGLSAP